MNEIKIIKRLVSEGYSLKAHHNNPDWKKALEDAELLIKELSKPKPHKIPECDPRTRHWVDLNHF
jgi:hypothetical protein